MIDNQNDCAEKSIFSPFDQSESGLKLRLNTFFTWSQNQKSGLRRSILKPGTRVLEPAKARSEESAVYTESGSSRGKGDDEGLVRRGKGAPQIERAT